MKALSELISYVDETAKIVRSSSGSQIFSRDVKSRLHRIAEMYFGEVAGLSTSSTDTLDGQVKALHALSRKSPSKSRCLQNLRNIKSGLIELESSAIAELRQQGHGQHGETDQLIVSSLEDVCPSAALAFKQALVDLSSNDRLSWRGPASDLREALRETLDVLAPDADVEAIPGYKPEGDAKRPTMKQKVRYILRSRGVASGAMLAPETAVQGIEEILGGLTRSVYTRSSVSTHVASDRDEVFRVLAWVRLVLCELLALPIR